MKHDRIWALRALGVLMLGSLLATPVGAQQPVPPAQQAPQRTMVLRGAVPPSASAPTPAPGYLPPTAPVAAPATPPPAPGWDAGGFDRRFDHGGLTPQ